jgi:hypothetical protein
MPFTLNSPKRRKPHILPAASKGSTSEMTGIVILQTIELNRGILSSPYMELQGTTLNGLALRHKWETLADGSTSRFLVSMVRTSAEAITQVQPNTSPY